MGWLKSSIVQGCGMYIGTLGFPEDQLKKLEKILALSKQKTFRLSKFDSGSLPDLMLLYGEEQLEEVTPGDLPEDFNNRLVVVSRKPPLREDLQHIKLPFISSRVIRALERFEPYNPTQSENADPVVALAEDEALSTDSVDDAGASSALAESAPKESFEAAEVAETEPSENRFSKYDAQIQALREQDVTATNASEMPYRVLVVDDSAPMQQALAKELEQLEYAVEISFADDGEAALGQVAQQHFDFIFLDIMMPGIDGFETCTRMRAIPELKKTPIIMLSSKSSPLDEVKGIMAGSSTYLTKPIQPEEFHKVIKRVTRWVSEFKKH